MLGCTLTETKLTFDPCCNKNLRRLSASIFNFAAVAGLAASRQSSPSRRCAARRWRAISGGRKPVHNRVSARISCAFATIGRVPSSSAR